MATALLAAAGAGGRLGAGTPKAFAEVAGRPLFAWALAALDAAATIDRAVIASPPDWEEAVEEAARGGGPVPGGLPDPRGHEPLALGQERAGGDRGRGRDPGPRCGPAARHPRADRPLRGAAPQVGLRRRRGRGARRGHDQGGRRGRPGDRDPGAQPPVGDPDAAGLHRRASCARRSTQATSRAPTTTPSWWSGSAATSGSSRRPARTSRSRPSTICGSRSGCWKRGMATLMLTDYHTHLRPDVADTPPAQYFTEDNVRRYLDARRGSKGIERAGLLRARLPLPREPRRSGSTRSGAQCAHDSLDEYVEFLDRACP